MQPLDTLTGCHAFLEGSLLMRLLLELLLLAVLVSPLEVIVKLTKLLPSLLEKTCQAIIVLSSLIICRDREKVRFSRNALSS